VYDTTSVPAQNATFGSVEFRRTITNNTGGSVSRLRVRIADERTFPAPSGTADMRDRTSTTGVVTVDRVPCGSSTSSVTVVGTTLEVPPAEPNGSAFNSTLGVSTVTLLAPLAAGASVDMRMNFGIQQTGADSARIVVEAVTDGTVSKPSLTCVGMTSTTVLTNFCTNAAPVATMDTYSVLANTALVVPTAGVLSNDTDADLQTVTVDSAATTTPSHGTLTLDADGSFTYTPTAGYSGPDSFTYKATDGTLDSNAATVEITVNPVAPQSFGAFIPMAPQRLLDTRSAGTPLPGGSIQQLHVAGREGIPDDAMAAVLNLTATGSTASGFLTVFPCGTAAPDASNLNFAAGETIANAATSTIGTNGNVCIYTNVTVSLIVDLNGAFSPTAGSALLTPMSPRRLLDTRFTGTKVAANTVQELMIAGVDGVPADATAAALNVTATGATSNGFMTVFPCGTAVPDASNLNFAAGETAANSVTATIGANGRVCFYTTATTDLIVDLNAAYNPTGSAWLQAVAAHRLLDTRVGGQQIAAGSVQQIQVAGSNGAPANAVAAVLNITATETGGAGFITVYPCGSTVPDVSNLNFAAGETVANSVTATVGTNGNVCFYTNAPIHLIVDFDAGFVVLT
jgi:VCBS repeat-containing protein